jgi:D-glycero-alpha-D-manno-heptose-7-phosphate kinase
MIISAAPFRISFGGGGSDIETYYSKRKGAVLSATINKYIYISIHPYFNRNETLLKYSRNELVSNINDIQHPILRESLEMLHPSGGIEIVSTADIPGGTGLGSSSSFTTALLHALYAYNGMFVNKEELSSKACEIEINRLGEPIGKQDQYAASYGGLNLIEFNPDDTVLVTPVTLKRKIITQLQDNLLLFYMGSQRNTREILQDQKKQISMSKEKFNNLGKMVDLAYEMCMQLQEGDLQGFGKSMHRGWELKCTLSGKITNNTINNYYNRALKYGALGGKLLGAGGGGFLLLYVESDKQDTIRKVLFDCYELPFKFDWGGSKIIYVGEHDIEEGFYSD